MVFKEHNCKLVLPPSRGLYKKWLMEYDGINHLKQIEINETAEFTM